MTHSDGGKGSGRRNEDVSKVKSNWDLIDWSVKETKKDTTMNDDPQERSDEDYERSEDEWTCDSCGGPMYRQAHWNYGQCDDCGARQELEDDY